MSYVGDHPEFRQYYFFLEKARIEWNFESMSKANEKILFSKTVVALLVGAMRADRFCWGAFHDFVECGCIERWLLKLKAVDDGEMMDYMPGIFDDVKKEKVLDQWDRLPEILTALGYEMDAYHSFEEYRKQSKLKMKPANSQREERRNTLYLLEHADRQIVGNYLFSAWRNFTHWSYMYSEYDVDFLVRIIQILESMYDKEYSDLPVHGELL